MGEIDVDHKLREIQREYLEFLDDKEEAGVYYEKIKQMIDDKKTRITVNVNDLRAKNPKRTTELLKNAFEEQMAFQKALLECVSSIDPTYAAEYDEFHISFEGSFGNKHVTPRTLTTYFLGNMVCVEGIVTKCSMVYPKIVKSVHYCPATKRTMERRYTDMTSFDPFPSSSVYPTKDDEGNVLETEYGECTYKDHQTLTIQEMPEKSPAGQLPRSVDIVCDGDLVDSCKPGDRVQIVGPYRCLPSKKGGFTSGSFRTILIANHIAQLNSADSSVNLTPEDVKHCRQISKRKDVFELLSKSLAPSIHGHEHVKKAILCMLLGGIEKVLANGTRLRGDINLLLIGDPSVAKSQLLRYVLYTAPRAITTTGRGSSGVGLTAAVTTDNETGERRLEAGAMVLADRGIVCIDEFDKMSDIDRTAIHEVMEQGRVTIAKAGIHARLNARCSVLAAANPVYGQYDEYRTPVENIGLQDSLLSRFDLLFVLLDKRDPESDRMISDHVIRMHKYRKPGEQDGEVLRTESAVDMLCTRNLADLSTEEQTAPMYEKYDALLHGNTRTRRDKILTVQFMRKYIHLAKKVKPVLTEEACALISEAYSKLRAKDLIGGAEAGQTQTARTQPITARTLETLIRLSTAHAKARMARRIEEVDAELAISLVQFAIFKEVLNKPKRKRRGDDDGEFTEEEGEESETEVDVDASEEAPRKRIRTDNDPYEFEEGSNNLDSQDVDLGLPPSSEEIVTSGQRFAGNAPLPPPTSITPERLKSFKTSTSNAFSQTNADYLKLENIVEQACRDLPEGERKFTAGEISAAIKQLTDENLIMLGDERMVFLI